MRRFTVFKPLPPALNRFDDGMSFEGITQRPRRVVIKEDEHAPLTASAAATVEASRRELQHRDDPVPRQVKPFRDLVDCVPRLEIFKHEALP
jgi:hypothetical protein